MTKPPSSSHLLLILRLRGSCHSSIHLSPCGVCHLSLWMLTFLQPPLTMQCQRLSSAALFTACNHLPSFPSVSCAVLTQTPFPSLSPVRLLHFTFAYGWVGACQAYVLCWDCASVYADYVWRAYCTTVNCRVRSAVYPRVLEPVLVRTGQV